MARNEHVSSLASGLIDKTYRSKITKGSRCNIRGSTGFQFHNSSRAWMALFNKSCSLTKCPLVWTSDNTGISHFPPAALKRPLHSTVPEVTFYQSLDIWKNDGAKTKLVRPSRPEQDNALPVSFLALSSRLVSFLAIIALTKSVLHNPAWNWRYLHYLSLDESYIRSNLLPQTHDTSRLIALDILMVRHYSTRISHFILYFTQIFIDTIVCTQLWYAIIFE